MQVIGYAAADRFAHKHPDAAKWLANWRRAATDATWNSLNDVRRQFPHADGVKIAGVVVTVFNVRGNEYRLLTRISYAKGIVAIVDVLTHAQYSRNQWKGRL